MTTDGHTPHTPDPWAPPPPRRPPGDPQWTTTAPATPADQTPADGGRAFAGPVPGSASGAVPGSASGGFAGQAPPAGAGPVPDWGGGAGSTPWGASRQPAGERVTSRVRKVVEGLPDWEPLPPGETLVRRPGGTG